MKKATIVIFESSIFEFVKIQSFMLTRKKKLGTKMSYLVIFELEFEKLLSYLKLATFEFGQKQSFMLN